MRRISNAIKYYDLFFNFVVCFFFCLIRLFATRPLWFTFFLFLYYVLLLLLPNQVQGVDIDPGLPTDWMIQSHALHTPHIRCSFANCMDSPSQ